MGVITVSIFQIFGGVVLNWKKAEKRMSANFKLGNLYILLSKKLDEIYMYKAVKDQEKYFDGKETSILFISFYSVKIPYFPVLTRLYLDNDNNLIMEEVPFFYDRPDAEIPDPIKMVLWEGVKEFNISYLVGGTIRNKGGSWEPEFVKRINKPEKLMAIKMEIILDDGEEITVFSYLKQDNNSNRGVSGGLL